MRHLLLLVFLCTTIACKELPLPLQAESNIVLPQVRYTPSDLRKLSWLAGAWQGTDGNKTLRQLFLFHDSNTLEVMDLSAGSGSASSFFVWSVGRYYFGPNRDWVVTWIGEKDVRFDPARAGVQPMSWVRQNDRQWHLVRHAPNGSTQEVLMERREEMQP